MRNRRKSSIHFTPSDISAKRNLAWQLLTECVPLQKELSDCVDHSSGELQQARTDAADAVADLFAQIGPIQHTGETLKAIQITVQFDTLLVERHLKKVLQRLRVTGSISRVRREGSPEFNTVIHLIAPQHKLYAAEVSLKSYLLKTFGVTSDRILVESSKDDIEPSRHTKAITILDTPADFHRCGSSGSNAHMHTRAARAHAHHTPDMHTRTTHTHTRRFRQQKYSG